MRRNGGRIEMPFAAAHESVHAQVFGRRQQRGSAAPGRFTGQRKPRPWVDERAGSLGLAPLANARRQYAQADLETEAPRPCGCSLPKLHWEHTASRRYTWDWKCKRCG